MSSQIEHLMTTSE